jgi:hypothetical protein
MVGQTMAWKLLNCCFDSLNAARRILFALMSDVIASHSSRIDTEWTDSARRVLLEIEHKNSNKNFQEER